MSKGFVPGYHHTQKAPWFLLLCGLGAIFLVVSWLIRDEPVRGYVFG